MRIRSCRIHGPLGHVMDFVLDLQPICASCDTPLTNEERRGGRGMYDEFLCHRCLEWVGGLLVAKLGADPNVVLLG